MEVRGVEIGGHALIAGGRFYKGVTMIVVAEVVLRLQCVFVLDLGLW
ncbi:hypothetical protein BSPWISOXPB_5051 [uncultured Gammaproteobacteria bacterium]|nr:hypothetical protein BSPWISOXPB_5051 [uncultured Gammaproteobacteria bacterium]